MSETMHTNWSRCRRQSVYRAALDGFRRCRILWDFQGGSHAVFGGRHYRRSWPLQVMYLCGRATWVGNDAGNAAACGSPLRRKCDSGPLPRM